MLGPDGQVPDLVLCRTPLQAKIFSEIISLAGTVSYDLIYVTHDDSETDRLYFSILAIGAARADYFFVKKKRLDVLNHLSILGKLYARGKLKGYKKIYLASIDSVAFGYIAKLNPAAEIFTFDDGAANITTSGHYHHEVGFSKAKLYSFFLGLPSLQKFKLRIVRHYSIYPGFINIVNKEKVTFLSVFKLIEGDKKKCDDVRVTFFIGQPFGEYLDKKSVDALRAWLQCNRIDYYVLHPREGVPLVHNIPVLEKHGHLAEDAIFKLAAGVRPCIISAYSTVLFNIHDEVADKYYLSFGNDELELRRLKLIEKTGSKVIKVL